MRPHPLGGLFFGGSQQQPTISQSLGVQPLGFLSGLGVVGRHRGAIGPERLPHVVGVGLKRQPPHGKAAALQGLGATEVLADQAMQTLPPPLTALP